MHQIILRVPTIDTILKVRLALLHKITRHHWVYYFKTTTESYSTGIPNEHGVGAEPVGTHLGTTHEIIERCKCGTLRTLPAPPREG